MYDSWVCARVLWLWLLVQVKRHATESEFVSLTFGLLLKYDSQSAMQLNWFVMVHACFLLCIR